MAKDRDQKTEDQSAKRKKESRKKGQVAKSPTLVSWTSLLFATFFLPSVVSRVGDVVTQGVRGIETITARPEPGVLLEQAGQVARGAFMALVPLLLAAMLWGIVGNLAQVGFVFATDPIKPKFERINPGAGLKRLVSIKTLWETGKQVLTLAVILVVAVPSVLAMSRRMLGSTWALGPALSEVGSSLLSLVQLVAVVGTLIGVADFAWQRFNLKRDSRMTKQEVKQETRESEGDPHVKAKLRQNGMAMSRNRMLASVGEADVVITNPTHFAVALEYEPTRGAPRVVARGADGMAQRIRRAAEDAGVPVVESPPLARTLPRVPRRRRDPRAAVPGGRHGAGLHPPPRGPAAARRAHQPVGAGHLDPRR
ncbi:MAG: EscU/YscU/HrcU family type III secretion system export apparatus switch protein [Actinomycetota bacterium]|nr:EscU/YscU/HrcU family type III secretion system export apparatus switch protein [Actinomycetota bacterium]